MSVHYLNMPYPAEQNEKDILSFWEDNKIFEKSVESRPADKPYVFYDGPPFATGLPHYGHILSSVIKDVVPRYWTMKGYRVRRRWGWDCHGLPIESLIEKDLKISGKKDIEEKVGVEKFCAQCHDTVLKYAGEWKKMVDRIGRWVEFDNSYKTMDSTYMESVWWAIKTLWDKKLVYEGRKVLLYCPRCETPVSKAEVAMDNSYKDVTEEAATVKFKVKNPGARGLPPDTYLLAWTTTPWTLPGNVALAVGADIVYAIVKVGNEHFVCAKDLTEKVMKDKSWEMSSEISGKDLAGIEYAPLFEISAENHPTPSVLKSQLSRAYQVYTADFVNTQEGTGIVHTAVVYGEDDYRLGLQVGLPVVPLLDGRGVFNEMSPEFVRGQYFKKAEKAIKDDLDARGLLFAREQNTHPYPHCWRCDTALIYNAISSWFIDIQKIKPRLIELNEKINWFPAHLKHGRFLHTIENAPDWNISRNRYWATPLPFWKCIGLDGVTNASSSCPTVCIGSVAELKEKAVNFDEVYGSGSTQEMDLHKHAMDKIKLRCECGGEMSRIPEVIDCWMEAASMPYAEFHYPFENKQVFEARFPGHYIAEYIAQTRTWFYYMHVLGVALFDNVSFENVVTTGTIMNEKGEKLSKSKQNYPDPWKIIGEYGVDALRYYLMTSVVMQAEDLNFNEREVRDAYNKVVNMLSNVVSFYEMYSASVTPPALWASPTTRGSDVRASTHILDRWILARLQELNAEVTRQMDNYDTVRAARPIKDFIDDLSVWYLRRSRERFKGDDEADKAAALATLHDVLYILSKIIAPFCPFIAESTYQKLANVPCESVHLDSWPMPDGEPDAEVLEQMRTARKVVEMGLSLRKDAGIRVRQPLGAVLVEGVKFSNELEQIITDELNVKDLRYGREEKEGVWKEDGKLFVYISTEITKELKKEGLAREIIRAINDIRKERKLTIDDRISVLYETDDAGLLAVFAEYTDEIKRGVLADEIKKGVRGTGSSFEIDGMKLALSVGKV